jgi:double-stranded uracil-DNA glycosylase
MRRSAKPVPDVIRPGLRLLLVGINPGLISARRRAHFANPANPFWRLLEESGLLPRRLEPGEQRELLAHGLGITNLVSRESASASELGPRDYERGRRELDRTLRRYRPRAVAFVGVTAYRSFARLPASKRVVCGEQPTSLHGARVFVLPNPSGRNAHYRYSDMLALFRGCKRALDGRGHSRRQGSLG